MKAIVLLAALFLMSFQTQPDTKITLVLTLDEVQLIYDGLGELPGKRTRGLEQKILTAVREQLDTVKKK